MNIMTGKCAAVLRDKLHRRLDALPPKARLATVAVMSAAFAAGCLYMTATCYGLNHLSFFNSISFRKEMTPYPR